LAVSLFAILALTVMPAMALANPPQGAVDPQLSKRVRREL
jgi:hypothetical protein